MPEMSHVIHMFRWVEIIAHNLMTCWCVVHDTLFVTNCLDGLGFKSLPTLGFLLQLKKRSSPDTFDRREGLGTCLSVKKTETSKGGPWKNSGLGVNFLDRTFCWSWKAPIFGCLEKHLEPRGWRHLTTFDGEQNIGAACSCNWQITSPKTNMDTRNDGVEKVDSFKIWPCLVSMLDFWGVYRQTFLCVLCVWE